MREAGLVKILCGRVRRGRAVCSDPEEFGRGTLAYGHQTMGPCRAGDRGRKRMCRPSRHDAVSHNDPIPTEA